MEGKMTWKEPDTFFPTHTGFVACGGMSQSESTLFGEPVNLTFRIESLTRTLGCSVLVTGELIEAADWLTEVSEDLGPPEIKGRRQLVEVWGLHTFPGD